MKPLPVSSSFAYAATSSSWKSSGEARAIISIRDPSARHRVRVHGLTRRGHTWERCGEMAGAMFLLAPVVLVPFWDSRWQRDPGRANGPHS
jgi:hypothetical protein